MRATLLVISREEIISTVTTNIRQYYTTDLQTDGILVLVQAEGDTTREISDVCYNVDILSSLDLTSSVALSLY
jgi:hypothetical protein